MILGEELTGIILRSNKIFILTLELKIVKNLTLLWQRRNILVAVFFLLIFFCKLYYYCIVSFFFKPHYKCLAAAAGEEFGLQLKCSSWFFVQSHQLDSSFIITYIVT